MPGWSYYNEHDPAKQAWLLELMKADLIAPGDIDGRDIRDILPNDLAGYSQHHFFAGIGVWSHALRLAGWPDDRPVWTGSCPCQPFSAAGGRKGTADERHLWPALFHLVERHRPGVILGEQVASKDGLAWLDLVSADLEGTGYAVGAVDSCAAGFGAPHIRQRLYLAAERLEHDARNGREQRRSEPSERGAGGGCGTNGCSGTGPTNGLWRDADWLLCRDGKWRPVEPGTFPLAHGIAGRVGLLRGYGDAIVAPQAAAFVEAYMEYAGHARWRGGDGPGET